MNRWILRGLVTAGFAGAAWALSSAAASAATTTVPDDPASITVTLDVGLGRLGDSPATPVGRPARIAVTAAVAPVRTPARKPTAAAHATVAIGQSTSDGGASANLDAAATIGRSTADDEAPATTASTASATIRAVVGADPVEEPVEAGPVGTGEEPVSGSGTDSGAGSVAGSGDPDTVTDPGSNPEPGIGSGLGAIPGTGVALPGTVDRITAGGRPLPRTGAPTAGLVLLALLMMLAGAALHRVGVRR
jgi:hypothetical protein